MCRRAGQVARLCARLPSSSQGEYTDPVFRSALEMRLRCKQFDGDLRERSTNSLGPGVSRRIDGTGVLPVTATEGRLVVSTGREALLGRGVTNVRPIQIMVCVRPRSQKTIQRRRAALREYALEGLEVRGLLSLITPVVSAHDRSPDLHAVATLVGSTLTDMPAGQRFDGCFAERGRRDQTVEFSEHCSARTRGAGLDQAAERRS